MRIGNGAYSQLQLDIYGELMDSVYLYNKYGSPISYDLWMSVRATGGLARRELGASPTRGSGRSAGGRQQFVYSKVMCWVAFDRALRMSRQRGLPATAHLGEPATRCTSKS